MLAVIASHEDPVLAERFIQELQEWNDFHASAEPEPDLIDLIPEIEYYEAEKEMARNEFRTE